MSGSPSGALAIHPGALGDVLLAVPALRLLSAVSGAPVTLAAQPRIGALLAALGVVDRALPFDALGLDRLFVDDGARAHCDAVATAAHVVCWFGARDPVFVPRLRQIAPGAAIASPTGDGPCVWTHLLATIAGLGRPDGSAGVTERRALSEAVDGTRISGLRRAVEVSDDLRREARAMLRTSGWDGAAPLVIVHPGAGGPVKRWPVERFAAALETLGAVRDVAVAVHEGPADAEPSAALVARLARSRPRPVLHLDEPALPLLAGILAIATAYLGNDSGVSHLAAAVGTPSLILFRAGNLPWRPWSPRVRALVVDPAAAAETETAAVAGALGALVSEGR